MRAAPQNLGQVLALGVVTTGFTAACSAGTSGSTGASSTAASTSVSAATASPANPVVVIKQAGAKTSAVYGQTDIYGDRYAKGDLPDATIPGCSVSYSSSANACLESVSVYTFATAADQARYQKLNGTSDDKVLISGKLFALVLYGVSSDGNTWKFPVSPATIAARVHGQVVSPS